MVNYFSCTLIGMPSLLTSSGVQFIARNELNDRRRSMYVCRDGEREAPVRLDAFVALENVQARAQQRSNNYFQQCKRRCAFEVICNRDMKQRTCFAIRIIRICILYLKKKKKKRKKEKKKKEREPQR
ncbi:hypothetical protein PUN28_018205 [Cardiocondyla obscurior]|uniref:Uncharacterized protein n=1 Tax=Cardiocondyla obscurior TaxID=286306 RepID=A0AAW2EKZ2_9HYME